jgi:peptide deformylase
LPLVQLPDARLRERSKEVDPKEISDPGFQSWLDDLVEAMRVYDGVGIAAPQTGRWVRVFVAADEGVPNIVINPTVKKRSWRKEDGEEGCLSVPGKYGIVSRHKAFTVSGLDRNGRPITLAGKGFFARVLQHEQDHLDGILYVDRAKEVYAYEPE